MPVSHSQVHPSRHSLWLSFASSHHATSRRFGRWLPSFEPHSKALKCWHQVLLAALLYQVFVIPFLIMFRPDHNDYQSVEAMVFYVCELLFLSDFYVRLNTSSFEDGTLDRDLNKARRKYLTSYGFMLDFIAILPLSLCGLPLPMSFSPVVLELHKFLRVSRLPQYYRNLDDVYATHFEALKLIKLLIATAFLSHCVACLRFGFGYDTHNHNHWLPQTSELDLLTKTTLTHYLTALFWAFGLLTGLFEGELPHSIVEFLFTILVAFCGFSLFTTVCATFFMLSKCENGQSEMAEARISQLRHVLTFHRVPEPIQHQTIEYLRRYYTDDDSNDREAIKVLCPSIATDIQVELLRPTIAKIPLFAHCDPSFIVALTSLLEMLSLPSRCTLFQQGDSGDAMYIVHSGVLDVVVQSRKLRELRKGNFVGELSLFSSKPRSATVVTTTYCILYKLSRFYTEKVLAGYPSAAATIQRRVQEILDATNRAEQVVDQEPTATKSHVGSRRKSVFASIKTTSKKKSVVAVAPAKQVDLKVTPETPVPPKRQKSVGILRSLRKPSADAVRNFYDQLVRSDTGDASGSWLVRRFLLSKCLDAHGKWRIRWLVALQLNLVFNWILVPLQLAFPLLDHSTSGLLVCNLFADLILWLDFYVNLNLSFTQNAEVIRDPVRSAKRYLTSPSASLDLLCALPYGQHAVWRLPRLFRLWRLRSHLNEMEQWFHLNSKRKLVLFGILLVFLVHMVACLHFGITQVEGFSPLDDAWIPSNDLEAQYFNSTHVILTYSNVTKPLYQVAWTQYTRSLYYATNVLTGLGRTIEPTTSNQYACALVLMTFGFFITAIVVDNVQKRFTASALEEKEFFATRSQIQLFLRRQNAPFGIYQRVNTYLDYWWAAHRGAILEELLVALPVNYKRQILQSICQPALQTLALLQNVRSDFEALEQVFVDHAVFQLYGQHEFLYRCGDTATGLFFLLEGSVRLLSRETREIPPGGFFGTQVLENSSQSGYGEDAQAISGCVVLFVSREDLAKMRHVFPTLEVALVALQKRLMDRKLGLKATLSKQTTAAGASATSRWLWRLTSAALDPDSVYIVAYETWLFIAMTVQWVVVLLHICYGVEVANHQAVDALTVVLELSFVLAILMRLRLGFYAFGNKVMELKQIRRHYVMSTDFAVDLLAVLPLFTINWTLTQRYEILNLNKLLRLLKVPKQFKALELRYLKRTMELRVVKLVYYAFLLSHIWGCLWFDFGSHASGVAMITFNATNDAFGGNKWLPPSHLRQADFSFQYLASLFWSFGLMSASTQWELPKTWAQCLFAVVTMLSGFFLFAYVIGNFTDILELMDAENREFNVKFANVRHLLKHFPLPAVVQERLKTYYFFKRFHTITQEAFLERCLPPSLVTDVRLVHLQPMIEKVPFLGGLEATITRLLVAQFRQVVILKHQHVYKYGDEGSDMYFVLNGRLEVCVHQSHAPIPMSTIQLIGSSPTLRDLLALQRVSELTSGDFFGENALFSDAPRQSFVRATTSCILYRLTRQSLELIFELHPDWKKRVLQSVKIQQKLQRLNKNQDLSHSDLFNNRSEASEQKPHVQPTQTTRRGSWDLQILRPRVKKPENGIFWQFFHGLEAQSPAHLRWLQLIICASVYTAIIVPYRIAIDSCDRWSGLPIAVKIVEYAVELLFIVDIFVNWKVKESDVSMELYEQPLWQTYRHDRLVYDVIAALPIDYVVSIAGFDANWVRLLRCVKIVNIVHYLNERHRQSTSFEVHRFTTITVIYAICIYWSACGYLAITVYDGYGIDWNAWLPTRDLQLLDPSNPNASQLMLRFLRGLFFATTAFVKKGRTFIPVSIASYVFSLIVCFLGLLIMTLMIGELASLYLSSIGNQVDFRKHDIHVQLFLKRWRVSRSIQSRTQLFMTTWWSFHHGVDFQSVLQDLPDTLRIETVLQIVKLPLQSFTDRVVRPVIGPDQHGLSGLLPLVAAQLRFEAYARGESVVQHGMVARAMYFVVKGQLVGLAGPNGRPIVRYRKGQCFGEHGLLCFVVRRMTIKTRKACDLFSLSAEALGVVLDSHPILQMAMAVVNELLTEIHALYASRITGTEEPDSSLVAKAEWIQTLHQILGQRRMQWTQELVNGTSSPGLLHWTSLLTDLLDHQPLERALELLEPLIELSMAEELLYPRLSTLALSPLSQFISPSGNQSLIQSTLSRRMSNGGYGTTAVRSVLNKLRVVEKPLVVPSTIE